MRGYVQLFFSWLLACETRKACSRDSPPARVWSLEVVGGVAHVVTRTITLSGALQRLLQRHVWNIPYAPGMRIPAFCRTGCRDPDQTGGH